MGGLHALNSWQRLAFEQKPRRLNQRWQWLVGRADPDSGVAARPSAFGRQRTDQSAQSTRGYDPNTIALEWRAIHPDGYENRHEPPSATAGVVELEITHVTQDLI